MRKPLVDKSVYNYVERAIGDKLISGIRLNSPPKYKGFVFAYKGGKFAEKNEQGQIPVSYEFDILDNKPNISDEELNGPEFSSLLGNIFVDIIYEISEFKKAHPELDKQEQCAIIDRWPKLELKI